MFQESQTNRSTRERAPSVKSEVRDEENKDKAGVPFGSMRELYDTLTSTEKRSALRAWIKHNVPSKGLGPKQPFSTVCNVKLFKPDIVGCLYMDKRV